MANNSYTDAKKSATHYRDALGFNVIPAIAGQKRAAIQWKEFQNRKVSDEEFENFDWSGNVVVITGAISGIVPLDLTTQSDLRRG